VPNLPQKKIQFLRWYVGPKSMLRIRIPVRLDPDLFWQILILERAMAVRSQLNAELEQNPPDLKTLILHL
jgi:hypothetical protein